MDEVFGKENFRNEIVWGYKRMASNKQRHFSKCHDILLCYGKTRTVTFNVEAVRLPYAESSKGRAGYKKTSLGGGRPSSGVCELNEKGRFPEDWWDIPIIRPNARERTGYPTQKPLALLERIIKASSNEGDVVLDPFCGCATTCVAAEKLGRQWVGIDISEKAAELVKERIHNELGLLLFKPIHRRDVPQDRAGERSRNIKHILYGKQEGMCRGCGYWYRIKDFEVDHIVPKSKGGADTDENLQLLCGNCNRIKGGKSQEYLVAQVRRTV
jgi:site-specific DNA-methyltransferase (adenine-specific)